MDDRLEVGQYLVYYLVYQYIYKYSSINQLIHVRNPQISINSCEESPDIRP
jgi:hypothetical protein